MTENGNMHAIKPARPDAEVAADLKKQVREKLEFVVAVMEIARSHGFRLTFNVGMDSFGRYVVQGVDVVKVL